jgi:hypothetical protein
MGAWLSTFVLLAAASGRPVRLPVRPHTISPTARLAGAVTNMTATPATISFQATDPDSPSVSGSSPGSVTWKATGIIPASWSLTVQAPAATFPGCPTVPVSAVRVTCTGVTVTGGGNGSCSGPVSLSTSAQNLAAGTEGLLNTTYTVNVTFTLTDSWKYIAQLSPQCSLSISYTANLN